MAYRPQTPPVVHVEGGRPDAYTGSPTCEKPVTPVTRFLSMTLREFEDQGRPLEVKVPGLSVTLWFVPGSSEQEALVSEGVSPGRIWTAAELTALWKFPSLTREQAQTLARIKAEF